MPKIALKTPTVPNYILEEDGDRKFSLSELTDEELNDLVELWKQALFNRKKELLSFREGD